MELTHRLLALMGASPKLVRHVPDRPGHDRRYSIDSSKVLALGWQPGHGFEEALAETVAWYQARQDWWRPLKNGEYLEYYRRQYGHRLAAEIAVD
jgi:dTDP-glucose 4,6-dehydratase